ncbi:MAG TPA: response regulator [bacterium]|nr:response regulator [bacterium]HDP97959.1 response regulator [bacterium]
MYEEDFGRVLIIAKNQGKAFSGLYDSLKSIQINIAMERELGTAIHRAQTERFDVVVLDAKLKGMSIERVIQIFKDIDPAMKIIIKTDVNSKELEAKIRKQAIYYYHLDSFGPEDLRMAIESAVRQKIGLTSSKLTKAVAPERKLIFMVDENDDFLEIHKANLESHHFQVEISFNADEAIKRIGDLKPDLIMVDLNIPVGSAGLHFIEMMTNDQDMIKIPVIIFISSERTDRHDQILKQVSATLPTFILMEKPVKIEDIVPCVESLLSDVES